MKNNILLTIGIPTYNREREIKYSLNSILDQVDEIDHNEIEIIISDNDSQDNTKSVVDEYVKRYPDLITYFKNDTNVGLDGNMNWLFQRAKGKYVWMFSDDDVMENGSIKYVLEILKEYKDLKAVFVNYEECDIDWNRKPKRWREDILCDVLCENGDEFWINSKFLFGLLSSIIIKTSDWNTVEVDKYFGTLWNFVGVMKEILAKDGRSYIVSDKKIRMRETGGFAWGQNGHFMKVMLDLGKIFLDMEKWGYKLETKKYLIDYLYRNNIRTIISAKIRNYEIKKNDFTLMVRTFKSYLGFWIFHIPTYFMPACFFTLANIARKGIIKRA